MLTSGSEILSTGAPGWHPSPATALLGTDALAVTLLGLYLAALARDLLACPAYLLMCPASPACG